MFSIRKTNYLILSLFCLFFCGVNPHFSLVAEESTINQEENAKSEIPLKDSTVKCAMTFTSPEEWIIADEKILAKIPGMVKMTVGKSTIEYPPSLNLVTEEYQGTLKSYLKIVKDINASKGAIWKDLGSIRTQAGNASLSQLDTQTEWGEVRMMHVILVKDGIAYILTAASLKVEFPKYYKEIFGALKSLHAVDEVD